MRLPFDGDRVIALKAIRRRVEPMLRNTNRNRLVGLWFAAVAVLIASVVVMGVNVGATTTALLLTLSLVPPGIIVALWPRAVPQTVGEILYAVNTRTERR
jgi:hypothetical protein